MRSRGQRALELGADQDAAEREAAADALGGRHDVGLHALLLDGQEGARAADTRLDLVDDELLVVDATDFDDLRHL